MLEFPAIQEVVEEKVAEARRKDILEVLKVRFKKVPRSLMLKVEAVVNPLELDNLVSLAASCSNLKTFQARLRS